jgi:hypothetical protein
MVGQVTAEGFRLNARYAQANDACKSGQYHLWYVAQRVYGPVKLLWRWDESVHDEEPAGYHRWNVRIVLTGAEVFVMTSNLGKQLTEMEVLAWAARE